MDNKLSRTQVKVLLYCNHIATITADQIDTDALVCPVCHLVQQFVVPITRLDVPDN